MNVVVVDCGHIDEDAIFPQLDLQKFGWIQYVFSEQELIPERCWRSDVIVSAKTLIGREAIDKAFKMQLIVAAGEKYDHIDLEAAAERGIMVCNTPGLDPDNKEQSRKLVLQVVNTINRFLKQNPINRVGG